jgi:peroxiredoxin
MFMKQWVFVAALGLSVSVKAQQQFTLQGKFKDSKPGAMALLDRRTSGEIIQDSAYLVNGQFVLKGKVSAPELAMLIIKNKDGEGEPEKRLLYLEPGTIRLAGTSLSTAAVESGTVNKGFEDYKRYISAFDSAMAGINRDYGASTPAQQQDTVFMNALSKRYHEAISHKQQLQQQYVKEHPASFFSVVALKELAVMNNMNLAVLTPMFNGLSAGVRNSAAGKEFQKAMDTERKLAVGAVAPDFVQNDINDHPVKLSDFRGKYVLLDFWASWCGPCRQENPNVLAAYRKYKEKNFMVLSVSLDQPGKKAAWLGAIEKDGLGDFVHVSDLKYWDNAVAKQYGVRGVPTNYLLGPDGRILGRNLRGPALEAKLAEVIK